jgi:large subunit ribosomal protein L5
MNYFQKFRKKNIKHDIINKFNIKNTKRIPKLNKVILNIGCKTSDLKSLSSSALALELITNQKSYLTLSKKPNLLLKIRKNNPTGCKTTLRKHNIDCFIERLISEIFPILKNFEGLSFKKSSFSYELKEPLNFKELEENYYLFNKISDIKITFNSYKKINEKQLIFLLQSLQLTKKF